MSDPNLILKDTGSVEQTNRLVCMYAETVFHDEQTLRLRVIHALKSFAIRNSLNVLMAEVILFRYCGFQRKGAKNPSKVSIRNLST